MAAVVVLPLVAEITTEPAPRRGANLATTRRSRASRTRPGIVVPPRRRRRERARTARARASFAASITLGEGLAGLYGGPGDLERDPVGVLGVAAVAEGGPSVVEADPGRV